MGRAPFPAPPSPNAQPAPRPGSVVPQSPQSQTTQSQGTQAPAQSLSGPRPVPAEKRTLVVGRGISVQGTVQDAERLVVEGTVEASMIHAAELHVAPGGVFRGEVQVTDAELAGTIDGTLTAHGNLVIRSSGRLLGTAKCRRLQVEDGGQVSGRLEMLTDAPGSSAQGTAQFEPSRSAPRVPEAVPPRADGIPATQL